MAEKPAVTKDPVAVLKPATEAVEPVSTPKQSRLTVGEIAAADDRPEKEIYVSEWGGSVVIRALSYDQIADARQSAWDPMKRETNDDKLNAYCMALGLVEPRIDPEIAKDWIINRAFGPVNLILSEILTASGLGSRAQAAAKSETPG